MKFLKFRYIPEAEVELTWADVASLLLYCERHYDRKCSDAGKIGGIVWGFRNRFEGISIAEMRAAKPIQVTLSAFDLNLLTKIAQVDEQLTQKISAIFRGVEEEYKLKNMTVERIADVTFTPAEAKKFPGRRRAKGRKSK